MFFLSLHPHLSPNTSTPSHCSFPHISSSLNPNPNNNSNNSNNHNNFLPVPSDPNSHSEAPIVKVKAPTPPWMKGPLLLQPKELLDLSKSYKRRSKRHVDDPERSDMALLGKEVRGKKVMKRISERVEKLRKNRDLGETQMGSVEKSEKFDGHFPHRVEKLRETHNSSGNQTAKVENFDGYLEKLKENGDEVRGKWRMPWEMDDHDDDEEVRGKSRMPWEKDEKIVLVTVKKEKVATAAELSLDKALLRRLRGEAAQMKTWVKVMKLGVTQDVVNEIRRTWRKSELAMVKFDIPLCRNMDRAREIVETKTGGLVVWSRNDSLVVYRGCGRALASKGSPNTYPGHIHNQGTSSYEMNRVEPSVNANHEGPLSTSIVDINCSGSLYEREVDRLLDGLGPRFIDWWYHKPLPVDADLLPEVVPGFKPPFRLCPPDSSAKLTDYEFTYYRKLAKPSPTHFVLGRNKRLQGLAAAILKLWEKSLIAKIAIKYGVQNTNNEAMADELKHLTGGVLLLRNKFYIILYRGNDFLPSSVASLVEKRELELKSCQLHEEAARMRAIEAFSSTHEPLEEAGTTGTLAEFKKIQTKLEDTERVNADFNIQLEAEIYRLEKLLKEQQRKAFILNKKMERSVLELSKLNAAWSPAEQDADLEVMTDEERECLRKIGLKMDSCLVLGRRGIFSGVLEGLHQHWKHREVVKVISMQRLISRVIYTAKWLEAESGGILVSVDKLKEGHAIIIYRGKNYRRPSEKVAKNLLTKREALRRSLEMQRLGSLKFFAHQRRQTITDLKLKLEELRQRKEQ